MKRKYKLLLCLLIAVTIFMIYLFINPIYFKVGQVLSPRRLPDLTSARNYYSILSSFAGFGLGILGLVAGYLYYIHKRSVEEETAKRERRRKRLDDLRTDLKAFDDFVDDLINFRFHNNEELERLRQKIHRSFETIVTMMDLNHLLLGLDDEDIATILKVYSFIDKNEILMQKDFREINASEFLDFMDEYVALVKNARLRCLMRVA